MPRHDLHAFKRPISASFAKIANLEHSGTNQGVLEDEEDFAEIERCWPDPETADSREWLDILCLEAAFRGVLLTLWCELTSYARDFAVPKSALRAMVQCAFLAELDRETFWIEVEGDPTPLNRCQYVKALKNAKLVEEARAENAEQSYRVPEEKWAEMLREAKTAGKSFLSNQH